MSGPELRTVGTRKLAVVLAGAVTLAAVGTGLLVLSGHVPAPFGEDEPVEPRFETVPSQYDSYTVELRTTRYGEGGPNTVTSRSSRYANGTTVAVTDFNRTGELNPRSNLTRAEAVTYANETGFRLRTYEPTYEPDRIVPHRFVSGDRVYDRTPTYSTGADQWVLPGFTYENDTTVSRPAGTFVRHNITGTQFESPDDTSVDGFVLVDENELVREAVVTVHTDGAKAYKYRYRASLEPSMTIPDWVETASDRVPPSQNGAGDRPKMHAYSTEGGVLITANRPWTPPEETTLTVLYTDDSRETMRLDPNESLFERHRTDEYRAFLTHENGQLTVHENASEERLDREKRVKTVIVDRYGVNYYDVPLESDLQFGSVSYVKTNHLRPANGGGRVVTIRGLERAGHLPSSASVTITVRNATRSRSASTKLKNVSGDSLQVARTRDGLAVADRNDSLSDWVQPSGYSDRRFARNASLLVSIDGVPVFRTRLVERLTQASAVPLADLRTGISVRTYDSPSAASGAHAYNANFERENWEGDTFVIVHTWDYPATDIYIGEKAVGECPVKHNCYFRVDDGTMIRIETPDGKVLVERPVDGNETIAPSHEIMDGSS